jgi:hypothetical protein|uniref:Uncharacterized protein n=1 Tax=Zea mays TaxID=4577 RepID=C4J239_MAIZE|nr:unknown [Zea mays]
MPGFLLANIFLLIVLPMFQFHLAMDLHNVFILAVLCMHSCIVHPVAENLKLAIV